MVAIKKTKTTTYEVIHAKADMFTFNENYRRIRGSMKYRGFACFNCGHRFLDGEKMGLMISNKGNKVLCRDCAVKLETDLGEVE